LNEHNFNEHKKLHLLWPVFTIQSYSGLKVKSNLSCFLPATKWKQAVFVTYLLVSISSLVKLLAIETNFFIFFVFVLEIHTWGPWYQIMHFLLFFLHMIIFRIFHFQDGSDVTNPAGPFPMYLACSLVQKQSNHRGPAQSVWVADCYLIVNVLDLPFASPIAIYR